MYEVGEVLGYCQVSWVPLYRRNADNLKNITYASLSPALRGSTTRCSSEFASKQHPDEICASSALNASERGTAPNLSLHKGAERVQGHTFFYHFNSMLRGFMLKKSETVTTYCLYGDSAELCVSL